MSTPTLDTNVPPTSSSLDDAPQAVTDASTISRPNGQDATPSSPSDAPRSITALAIVQLSARGRRASLLAGGDGRAIQRLHVNLPPEDADLVRVNRRGEASLVLGPRIAPTPGGQLRRVREVPLYDVIPSGGQLLTDARALATLRQAYVTQRSLAYSSAKDAYAEDFLQNLALRAVVHPPPTTERCACRTDKGVLMFRHTDAGPSAAVPVEAHRRFRADLAERTRKNQSQAARDMAIHQAKHLSMARWIEQHGSAEQQARLSAGRLSDEDMYEAIADVVFAPLGQYQRYVHDARGDLLRHYREVDASGPGDIPPSHVKVDSSIVVHLSAEQWKQLAAMQAVLPQALMTVRRYRIYWSDRPERHDPHVVQYAVLVKHRLEPLVIVRSYVLPAPHEQAAMKSSGGAS